MQEPNPNVKYLTVFVQLTIVLKPSATIIALSPAQAILVLAP